MKLSIPTGCLLAVCVLFAPAAGQAVVSPLVVESSPSAITIANTGMQPLRLLMEPMDFDQDANGRTRFGAVGSSAHSCGDRLRLGEAPTQIPARGEVRIPVSVEPDGGPCWGAVMVRISTGFAAAGRIGVKVYSLPAGAARTAEVSSVRLARDSIHVEIINTGPTPVRPRGRVEVRTLQGTTVATREIEAFGIHPGIRRSVALPLDPRVPAGPHVVLAIFDIGARDLLAGEVRIDVPTRAPDRK
jgi:hypothetical protein